MAYCRFGEDSDVYMYSSIIGGFQFHITDRNSLGKTGIDFHVPTIEDALHRMTRLKTQGFKVPEYALDRLRSELLLL